MHRDRATAMCCAFDLKVHCEVAGTIFRSDVIQQHSDDNMLACILMQQRVGQFKPIFQVAGNTFRPIFFGYFVADCLLYNFATGSFHITKLCSKNWKIAFWATFWETWWNVCTPYIARWKAHGGMVDFIFVITELFRYLLQLRRYKQKSVEVGIFRRGWVTLRLNFRLKGHFSH